MSAQYYTLSSLIITSYILSYTVFMSEKTQPPEKFELSIFIPHNTHVIINETADLTHVNVFVQ